MINSEYQQKTSLLFEFSMKTGDYFQIADPLSQIQLVVNLVPFLSTYSCCMSVHFSVHGNTVYKIDRHRLLTSKITKPNIG